MAQPPPNSQRHVWVLARWYWFEPDPRYRSQEPTPLDYLRWPVDEHRVSPKVRITRAAMDQERRRLYAAGGPGLRGIYRALCEYAGDRPYLRGFLLTPDDRPATPDDLASALHLPAKEIAKALRTLSEMQPALVQRVLYEDVEKDLLEARMASQPGETTPTGGESIRDEEVGEHPSDGGSRCSRSICSPEMTDGPRPAGMPSRDDGAPEGRDPPDRSDARGDARPNSNMNVNVELPAGAGKHPPVHLPGGRRTGGETETKNTTRHRTMPRRRRKRRL